MKKKGFQGIHDRFLRDHIFRGRMIENSRDEEVCRRWNVLADAYHTYTNNGSRHRVRPLHGGNGKTLGGLLLKIQSVKEEASKVLGMNGETRY